MLQGNDKNASFPEAQASGILFLQTHKTKKFKNKFSPSRVQSEEWMAFLPSNSTPPTRLRFAGNHPPASRPWCPSYHFQK